MLRGLLWSPPFTRFIYARMWGRGVLPTAQPAPLSTTLSPALSVYLCDNVAPQGLLVVRLPVPFIPHSASLGPATATQVLSTLVRSPPLLPVWKNVYFLFPWCRTPLPFYFLSVLVVRGGAVCVHTPSSRFLRCRFLGAEFWAQLFPRIHGYLGYGFQGYGILA